VRVSIAMQLNSTRRRVELSCVAINGLLVLDPRGRLRGKAGSACEEFEDNEGSILG